MRDAWRQLGAIACVCLAVLAISGVWLYAVLDTSAGGAWASIAEGGTVVALMRSLHRYAADGFVAVMALHALREGLLGHTKGFRAWSWLSGVALIVLVYVSAIGGFWLHWDQLGQYSATATAEWLDALPLLANPLARNVLTAVSDRLFSLFVFIHIGVALLITLGLWLHVMRLARPAVWPQAATAIGVGGGLLVLALLWPVASHAPADLAVVPQSLRLDWWLLFVHPLAETIGAGPTWWVLVLMLATLAALAFVPQRREPVALVDPANCNGCRRCLADCPFAAITMVPHPQKSIGREMAVVDAQLCASCGICAGACPSSTPFRSVADLVSGIDLPQAPVAALRKRLQQALVALGARHKIVVFGCNRGAALPQAGDVAALPLVCVGALPPSFVEYALRDGAAGVLVSGCRDDGCEFRLGARWTDQRLRGAREPHLRESVPYERVETAWADRGEEPAVHAALRRLRERVQAMPQAGHA